MKKTVFGFIGGVLTAVCVTAFAAQMEMVDNPYKILVNNVETAIQGYNIDGSSYFKLRDIGDAMGFTVDFQNNTIVLTGGAKGNPQGPGGQAMTLEEFKAKMTEDVAAGKITQEEADEQIAKFSQMPDLPEQNMTPPSDDVTTDDSATTEDDTISE